MRRAAILFLLAVGLPLGAAGCGFTPMYAEPLTGSGLRRIAVSTPDNRLGYRLREQLEDALGFDRASPPLYRLETSVEQERRALGRRIDDTASRYELTVPVDNSDDPGCVLRVRRYPDEAGAVQIQNEPLCETNTNPYPNQPNTTKTKLHLTTTTNKKHYFLN